MKHGKRSRCGGKYSKRKGYNKKHYTRKYGRRTRTRTKRGGVTLNEFITDPGVNDYQLVEGNAKFTKLKNRNEVDFFSKEDRDEYLRIYQKPRRDTEGNMVQYGDEFIIFRTLPNGDSPEGMSTRSFSVTEPNPDRSIYAYFTTSKGEQKLYRIKVSPDLSPDLSHKSLYSFLKNYNKSDFTYPGVDGRQRIQKQEDAEQERLRRIVQISPDAYKLRDDMRNGMFNVKGQSDLPGLNYFIPGTQTTG
jgi:hypothetical protein